MKYLLLILLLPSVAFAATRDFPIQWSQECSTVEGDTLDEDGDYIAGKLA